MHYCKPPFAPYVVEEVRRISQVALGNAVDFGESSLFLEESFWPEHRCLASILRRDPNLLPRRASQICTLIDFFNPEPRHEMRSLDPLLVNPTDYKRVKCIWSKGNVAIYLTSANESVVLKVFKASTESEKKLFTREVEVMRQMTHPATLSLCGYALPTPPQHEGVIVMNYMHNNSLAEVNKRFYNESASFREWGATARSKAALGIASGMWFLHSLGLMHCDLKPENIFVDRNYEVHIGDFGSTVDTRTGGLVGQGTPLTQAPEVTASKGPITNKIDVYSFAICLYSLFCPPGQLDDNGPDWQKVVNPADQIKNFQTRVRNGARFQQNSAIPAFYWNLITACWIREPDKRPTFAEILERFRKKPGWVLGESDPVAIKAYWNLIFKDVPTPPGAQRAQPISERIVALSNYTNRRDLTSGTNCVIRRATAPNSAEVVLKLFTTAQSEESFLREVQVMAQMTHPATLSLIGWAPTTAADQHGLIVMDYMPNGSLDDINKKFYDGRPPWWWNATARSKAVIRIITGMAFVHSLGLIHRDLKPANIFFDENFEARIGGFGRARKEDLVLSGDESQSLICAPEAYDSSRYTNKSDVYSFGVTLYLMWASPTRLDDQPGRAMPAAVDERMKRICAGARFVRHESIPSSYWKLITMCCQSEPKDRPSFAQLLEDAQKDRWWEKDTEPEAHEAGGRWREIPKQCIKALKQCINAHETGGRWWWLCIVASIALVVCMVLMCRRTPGDKAPK
jgi:serine/threonine protein kinase